MRMNECSENHEKKKKNENVSDGTWETKNDKNEFIENVIQFSVPMFKINNRKVERVK